MKAPKKNWLEWIVFGVSFCLILLTAGVLLWQHFTGTKSPPDPQVALGEIRAHDGYFAVALRISNRGDTTAENVRVEVALASPDGQSETAGFELPFLPRHAERVGWVTFREDPRRGKLDARVVGYQEP